MLDLPRLRVAGTRLVDEADEDVTLTGFALAGCDNRTRNGESDD